MSTGEKCRGLIENFDLKCDGTRDLSRGIDLKK